MATAFVVTAQLRMTGPANLRPVISRIQQQLSNINATVNVRLGQGVGSSINNLTTQLQMLNTTLTAINNNRGATRTFNNVGNSARGAARHIHEATNAAEAFGEQIGLSARRFTSFTIAAGTLLGLARAMQEGVKSAFEFQREMTRFSQVGNDSVDTIKGVAEEISRLGSTLGASSSDLSKMATTLRQAGLSANDTKTAMETLARTTLSPTFTDITNTGEGMIAIMQQFKVEAKDLQGVFGSLSAVSAQYAVESDDLVHVIRRSGGAFKTAGGNLNELISLFTSVRSTTRESAETIATGFNTIFGRLQRSDTVDQLKSLGVNLRYGAAEAKAFGKTEGEFVGPYEAIRRLNKALKDVPPASPVYAQIVEQVGGLRQISKVVPLLQQAALQEKVLGTATGGTSALLRDNAKAQGSVLVQVQQLKEEFLDLFRTIAGNKSVQDFTKMLITAARWAVFAAKAITPLVPLIAGLGAIQIGRTIGLFGNTGFTTGLRRGLARRPFARGGPVPGVGETDSVPAILMPGEFVIRKSAAKAIGYDRLSEYNRMAGGGITLPKQYKISQINLIGTPTENLPGEIKIVKSPKAAAVAKKRLEKAKVDEKTINDIISSVDLKANTKRYVLSKDLADNLFNKQVADPIYDIIDNTVKEYQMGPKNNRFYPTYSIRQDSTARGSLEGFLFEAFTSMISGHPATGEKGSFDFDSISGRPIGRFAQLLKDQPFDSNFADAKNTTRSSTEIIKKAADRGLFNNKMTVPALTANYKRIIKSRIESKQAADLKKLQEQSAQAATKRYTPKVEFPKESNEPLDFGIRPFASGGLIDKGVPSLLTPGEFVINSSAARRIGYGNLYRWNRFAGGGAVDISHLIEQLKGHGLEFPGVGRSTKAALERSRITEVNVSPRSLSGLHEQRAAKSGDFLSAISELAHAHNYGTGMSPYSSHRGTPEGQIGRGFAGLLPRLIGRRAYRGKYGKSGPQDIHAEGFAQAIQYFIRSKQGSLSRREAKLLNKPASRQVFDLLQKHFRPTQSISQFEGVTTGGDFEKLSPLTGELTPATDPKPRRMQSPDFPSLSGIFTKRRMADGGMSRGVPSLLTPGEFIINASSARRIGYGNLHRWNRFAGGGQAGGNQAIDVNDLVKRLAEYGIELPGVERHVKSVQIGELGKGVAGKYEMGSGTVRLRNLNEPHYAAHEFSHAYDLGSGTGQLSATEGHPANEIAKSFKDLVPKLLGEKKYKQHYVGISPETELAEGFAYAVQSFVEHIREKKGETPANKPISTEKAKLLSSPAAQKAFALLQQHFAVSGQALPANVPVPPQTYTPIPLSNVPSNIIAPPPNTPSIFDFPNLPDQSQEIADANLAFGGKTRRRRAKRPKQFKPDDVGGAIYDLAPKGKPIGQVAKEQDCCSRQLKVLQDILKAIKSKGGGGTRGSKTEEGGATEEGTPPTGGLTRGQKIKLIGAGLLQFAPMIAERALGTPEQTKPGETTYGGYHRASIGQAVGGAVAGASAGIALGSFAGPLGSVIAGTIGGFRGLIGSLNDTEEQIKSIQIGKTMKEFGDYVEQITNKEGTLTSRDIGRGQTFIGNLQQKTIEAGGNRDQFFTENVDTALLQRLAEKAATSAGIKGTDTAEARQQKFLTANAGLGRNVISLLSQAPELRDKTFSQIFEPIDELAKKIAIENERIKISTEQIEKVNLQTHNFERLSQALVAATQKLEVFDEGLDATSSMFEGVYQVGPTKQFTTAAAGFGGPNIGDFNKSIDFITNPAKGLGGNFTSDFGRTAKGVNLAQNLLPTILSEFSAQSHQLTEENFTTQFGNITERIGKDIPEELRNQLKITFGSFKIEDLLGRVKTDQAGIIEELINKSFPNLRDVINTANEALQDNFNKYNNNLQRFQEMTNKIIEAGNRVRELNLEARATRFQFAAERQGLTGQHTQLPIRFRLGVERANQEALTGGAGIRGAAAFNPAAIGDALRSITDRIHNLQNTQTTSTDFNTRRDATKQINDLGGTAGRLRQALENLTKSSETLKDRLHQLNDEEEKRLGLAEEFATSSVAERFHQVRVAGAARAVAGGANIDFFPPQMRKEIFDFFHKVNDIATPVLGGHTGEEVRRGVLGRVLSPAQEAERGAIQQQIAAGAEVAAKAAQELKSAMESAQADFYEGIETRFADFLTTYKNILVTGAQRDVQQRETALRGTVDKVKEQQRAASGVSEFGFGGNLEAARTVAGQLPNLVTQQTQLTGLQRLSQQPIQIDEAALGTLAQKHKDIMEKGSLLSVAQGILGMGPLQNILNQMKSTVKENLKERIGLTDREGEDVVTRGFNDARALTIGQGGVSSQSFIPVLKEQLQSLVSELINKRKTEKETEVNTSIVKLETESGLQPGQGRNILAQNEQFLKLIKTLEGVTDLSQLQTQANGNAKALKEATASLAEFKRQLDLINLPAQKPPAELPANQPPVVAAQPKARGGSIFKPKGTDTVPAMLTPGEFVVNAKSARKNKQLLENINSDQAMMSRGGFLPAYLQSGGMFGAGRRISHEEALKMISEQKQKDYERNKSFQDNLQTSILPQANEQYLRRARKTNKMIAFAGLSSRQRQSQVLQQTAGQYVSENNIYTAGELLNRADAIEQGTDTYRYNGPRFNRSQLSRISRYQQRQHQQLIPNQSRQSQYNRKLAIRQQNRQAYYQNLAFFGYARGGSVDSVPAMLSPGEFVVNARSARTNSGLLNAINKSAGGNVIYRQGGGEIPGGAAGNDTGGFTQIVNSLNSFTSNLQSLKNPFDTFNAAATNLGVGLTQFSTQLPELIRALGNLANLPTTITVQGTTNVNVNVTGGEAFNAIRNSIMEEVSIQVAAKLKPEIISEFKSGNVLA